MPSGIYTRKNSLNPPIKSKTPEYNRWYQKQLRERD